MAEVATSDVRIEPSANDNTDEEDDLITLSGFNQITQWRFPAGKTKCPIKKCKVQFGVRSDAIRHYKKKHADHSVLCEICNRPISAKLNMNFRSHYFKVHPGVAFPYDDLDLLGETDSVDSSIVNKPILRRSLRNDTDSSEGGSIALNGGGVWQFPNDMVHCPICGPGRADLSRIKLIDHYKRHHAPWAILCQICNEPISIQKDPNNFMKHYKTIHPDSELPDASHELPRSQMRLLSPTANRSGENDPDYDLIPLYGCGLVTHWRFPDILHCPFIRCDVTFNDRLAGIDHYKENHTKKATLCPLCKPPKPITGLRNTFIEHCESKHPNEELPYNFSKKQYKRQSNANESDHEEDDTIPLYGANQVTYWQFPPNERACPSPYCDGVFLTRSLAIAHYKKTHAKNATLCALCNKPVCAPKPKDFLRHHQKHHPNHSVPRNIADKLTEAEMMHFSISVSNEEENVNGSINTSTNQSFNKSINKSVNKKKAKEKHGAETLDGSEDDLIKLSGFGEDYYWPFPPNSMQCPSPNCLKQFETRSDAIRHYKDEHAYLNFFCTICQYPKSRSNAIKHYLQQHPGIQPPGKDTMPERKIKAEKVNQREENDEITLHACGVETKWKFPLNLTRCPVHRCGAEFQVRANLIKHYKKEHANNSILCPLCDKPICIGSNLTCFSGHYLRVHPDQKMPYNLSANLQLKTLQSIMKRRKSVYVEPIEDLIILQGCGRVTKWKFPPDLTQCPPCKQTFPSRSELIVHYKQTHTKSHIFCSICNWPIQASSPQTFNSHYEQEHPNDERPFELNSLSTPKLEPAVSRLNRKQERKQELKPPSDVASPIDLPSVASKPPIQCPMISCLYKSRQEEKVRRHWDREHPNFRFPELKTGTDFTWTKDTQHAPNVDLKASNLKASTPAVYSSMPSTSTGFSSASNLDSSPSCSESDYVPAQDDLNEPSDVVDERECVSDVSLLELCQTNPTEDVSSSAESTEDSGFDCLICGSRLRTQFGLRIHTMRKHNVHSVKKRARVKKQMMDRASKKRKLMIESSDDSEDANVKLSELAKRRTKRLKKGMKDCSIVLERLQMDIVEKNDNEDDEGDAPHQAEEDNQPLEDRQPVEEDGFNGEPNQQQIENNTDYPNEFINDQHAGSDDEHRAEFTNSSVNLDASMDNALNVKEESLNESPLQSQKVQIISQAIIRPPSNQFYAETPSFQREELVNGYLELANSHNFFDDPAMDITYNNDLNDLMVNSIGGQSQNGSYETAMQMVEINNIHQANDEPVSDSDSDVIIVSNGTDEIFSIPGSEAESDHDKSHVKAMQVLMLVKKEK